MSGSSPGAHHIGEANASSSGQYHLATNDEDGDDAAGHQNLDSTLLDDDPLGDLSQAQLVLP